MERDPTSRKNGYTLASYLDTLYWGLLPMYDNELFMQDNAPIHTADVVRAWFNNEGINTLIGWPPYSPDLNPIEHLWPQLKELIYKLNPELDSITNKDAERYRLIEVLPKAYEQMPVKTVEACLKSMRLRLQAVINIGGSHTKY